MRNLRLYICLATLLLPRFGMAAVSKQSKLVLNRAWVEKYKDRATIAGEITIDHAGPVKTPRASSPSNDGDIHAASRSTDVGLPMVAEIMNAKDVLNAVKRVKDAEGQQADFTGVWRLWFEHPPSGQTQAQDLTKLGQAGTNTNPAHCFEVHPLTKFDHIDLQKTFHSVPGYEPKDATTAFGRYEKLKISLSANAKTVTLSSQMIGFNYVEFKLRLQKKAIDLVKDEQGAATGKQAMVDIYALDASDDDDPLATDIRAIFVAETEPEQAVVKLGAGGEMAVWGIPRLNLNAVSTFLSAGGTQAADRKLTYEMVIVAVESSADEEGAPSATRKRTSTGGRQHNPK
jgi:hypothetical protein